MEFDWTVNVGNIAVILAAVISGVIAWSKMSSRSERNSEAIKDIRATVDRKAERAALAELRAYFEERTRGIHSRYDLHQSDIADSLKAIQIEMRAMHAEHARFREQVASVHPTRSELSDVLNLLRTDIKELAARVEKGPLNG